MDIRTTPEFAEGYEWAARFATGPLSTMDVIAEAARAARHLYAKDKRLDRDWLFIGGVWQRLADAGFPDAIPAAEAYLNWYVRQDMEEKKRPRFPAHYINIVTPGPLIYVRLPEPRPKPWKRVLKALTGIMESHGLRQKDISAMSEGVDPDYTPSEAVFATRLDAAFEGDPEKLSRFWLYDWEDGEFVLVREPMV